MISKIRNRLFQNSLSSRQTLQLMILVIMFLSLVVVVTTAIAPVPLSHHAEPGNTVVKLQRR